MVLELDMEAGFAVLGITRKGEDGRATGKAADSIRIDKRQMALET